MRWASLTIQSQRNIVQKYNEEMAKKIKLIFVHKYFAECTISVKSKSQISHIMHSLSLPHENSMIIIT